MADRERRNSKSFAEAAEQLSSDNLETRLGAIYTLERIARDSEREYWPIMETLTAYVREHAPWPPRQALARPFVELQRSTPSERAAGNTLRERPENEAEQAKVRPATDIQAILTVLGRRDENARTHDEAAERRLDLTAVDLRGARLPGAHLEHTNLAEAPLEGADLRGACLEGAYLRGAHLEGADLGTAHLEGADLGTARLAGADLQGAHLEGTYLRGARLDGANLRGARLAGADLGTARLEGADLRGSDLEGDDLEGADLAAAHLQRAHLAEAYLQRADLRGARLESADLRGAHLEHTNLAEAHLEGADLTGAAGLTQEQLDMASGDDRTVLPAGLTRPMRWSAATPEEQPDQPANSR